MAVECKWAPVALSRSEFFSSVVSRLVAASQTPALYIKASPLCERHFLNASHVCGCGQGVLGLCTGLRAVTNLGLLDWLLFEQTKTRHKRAKSVTLHMAASKGASFFIPPSLSFLSLLLSSTFNVWHFDTEHPIFHVLVGWLYMQMGW